MCSQLRVTRPSLPAQTILPRCFCTDVWINLHGMHKRIHAKSAACSGQLRLLPAILPDIASLVWSMSCLLTLLVVQTIYTPYFHPPSLGLARCLAPFQKLPARGCMQLPGNNWYLLMLLFLPRVPAWYMARILSISPRAQGSATRGKTRQTRLSSMLTSMYYYQKAKVAKSMALARLTERSWPFFPCLSSPPADSSALSLLK